METACGADDVFEPERRLGSSEGSTGSGGANLLPPRRAWGADDVFEPERKLGSSEGSAGSGGANLLPPRWAWPADPDADDAADRTGGSAGSGGGEACPTVSGSRLGNLGSG
mmetsp:Transcript_54281/g.176430  ORF Transcript_54281/g.176430 Transcript_54281/m.176430 type:complete len:111 (-) Transcript_54281:4871-5203(-)